ncbi:HAD family hydrolase [Halanaerobacter jeridensis]|uniref:Cof subfamily protein (Haloacid dehalogenase superfamily) n=1 Tax=Halanaerobacter jeridensis TaxID=706427 RepID=A0A938XSY8_9FIRM|nr:HAD family hydrolase [Halanaerobacter jeridensis]MBM7556294.1 Cof subfamily protein (haloacid dehalogenase superfamily) [Halanaerobacter jeridensis]
MYKLVVLDLDGTLLTNDSIISSYSKEILLDLAAQDVKIILASGRPYQSMLAFAKELELNTPLIANNGALIKRPSGEVLAQNFIEVELAEQILNYAKQRDLHISFYFTDQICVEEITDKADVHIEEEKVMPQAVGDLKKRLDEPPINILFNIDKKIMRKTVRDLKKRFGESLSIVQTTENYIDVTGQNVNKGVGLKALLKKYNLSPQDVVSFGNNYNDLDMLELADLGVVTDNAPQEVKEQADMVTVSNEEHGVAKALEKIFI